MRTPIPTTEGEKVPEPDDIHYMEYLDNLYDAPNYGLLSFKGDPAAFRMGKEEWKAAQEEKDHEQSDQETA